MVRRLAALWLALSALLAATPAPAELRVYRARSRPAEELAAIAEPLLAPEGSAVGDSAAGVVLLRGPATLVDEAEAALGELDVLPRQFRVRSELHRREWLEARGLEIAGRVRVGDVWVGRLRGGFPQRDPRDDAGAGPFDADPEAADSGARHFDAHGRAVVRSLRAEDRDLFRAELVVMEGRVGEIWTGQSFPVAVRTFRGGRGRGHRVDETTAWVPVRKGLAVIARGVPESGEVDLEVWPIAQDGRPETGIRQTGATTRLRLVPGETLVIGAVEAGEDTRHADIGAWGGLAGDTDTRLFLRVDPLE